VINWEAPITTTFKFNPLKKPAIATTKQSAIFFCENFSFDLACLGNNHTGDCFTEGLQTTIETLQAEGIDYYGASTLSQSSVRDATININNKKFTFLSFVGSETNPKIAEGDAVYINELVEEDIVQKIQKLKANTDYIVLTLHWGIELLQYPSLNQRELAKRCIDAGANVIIGHHSHTLQGVETYKNGLIAYSLGNFVFSGVKGRETFAFPKICLPSGCLEVKFDKEITHKFFPFEYSNEGVVLLDETKRKKAIKYFERLSSAFDKSTRAYKINHRFNAFLNWFILFPLFMIKVKGGVFKAAAQYAKPQYLKLILGYFKK
jgi:hypothetical protein